MRDKPLVVIDPHIRRINEIFSPAGLDYARCFDRRFRVLSASPAFGPQVAEMALGLVLAGSREIAAGDRAMREGTELWFQVGNVGTFLLYGARVGLIGCGSLARALRPLLAHFGCPLSVYDPWLGAGYLHSQGVEPIDLEPLLENCRIIFVLAAPTVENHTLLSRQLLERIGPDAVLVLLSRAHVVDFAARTELVLAGRFKAAIDVFPNEPLAPDHPIRRAPNAVLSAHRVGSVPEGLWEIGTMVVDDLEAIARGLPPQRLQVAQPEVAASVRDQVLGAHAGLRVAEACAVRWEAVDFATGRLVVEAGKGGKRRVVPLSASLRAALLALGPGKGEERVAPITADVIRERIERLARKAGLRYRGYHALRHAAGTRAAREGLGLEGIATFLGHGNVQTSRIYEHWTDESVRQTVSAW